MNLKGRETDLHMETEIPEYTLSGLKDFVERMEEGMVLDIEIGGRKCMD